ncbi:MAG TPA: pyridoxamine 5'-phosphate oxidase family protein [Chitinophagaceae bacterium]
MNEIIKQFIQRQTCATICCTDEESRPYCFSCFYAFNPEKGLLYFKSSDDTYHSALMKRNPGIAGTILPDKLNKLVIRGIQLEGEVLEPFHPLAKDAFAVYHKNFPMALAIKGKVFTIRLDVVKMTDSQLGFGKKIDWKRSEAEMIMATSN